MPEKPASFLGLTPSLWASWVPFGLNAQHPNNFGEVFRAAWENREQAGYAWRILNQGCCDGCALGTTGMKDWTLKGAHLCNIRLRLLRMNTQPAFDPAMLADVSALKDRPSAELRELGRLPAPMVRRAGEKGFSRVSWDEALDLVAAAIHASTPDRLGFYLTSRGMPNEGYYGAQKAARAIGTNSIDNAARICHSPSTVALKASIGVGATTCSYPDWIGSDLIVFVGANPANNQPVTTKYLYYAKKAGTQVVMVNNVREPGMEHYWVPSLPESALFGTKIADRFFMVNTGGDIAFLGGVLKHLIETDQVDHDFIANHTTGFAELAEHVRGLDWAFLERESGLSRADMVELGDRIGRAKTAVFVWSMGLTQHDCGEDGVRMLVNIALTSGFLGRDRCGVMPIRGHSGVQGGAEMGAYSTAFPGGLPITAENAARLTELWGFDVPTTRGITSPEMIDAAHAGNLDVLVSVGGNFTEVLPDPDYVRDALRRIKVRVHMDIVLSSQMLLEAEEVVVLLPAMTRYEVPGGVTSTSTERRVIFSPEIEGPRVAEARHEADALLDLARRVRPEIADRLRFADTAALRAEIARVVPMYDGIQRLSKKGDQFQYGGAHLCEGWRFPTADGKAHFGAVPVPQKAAPEGFFKVRTRRGKQFNSMIHELKDPLNGAQRDHVLMSAADAAKLGLQAGDAVRLRSDLGEYAGRVFISDIKPGSLQIHWPEGNVLIPRGQRSPNAGMPDYNAFVSVEKM